MRSSRFPITPDTREKTLYHTTHLRYVAGLHHQPTPSRDKFMPRRQATALTTEELVTTEQLAVQPTEAPTSGQATGGAETRVPLSAREQSTGNLGDSKQSPKMHLLRSGRFNQMQIRSEAPLSEKHQDDLKTACWMDRTEQEGVWSKQLPREDENGGP
jgi:hypothetical protein